MKDTLRAIAYPRVWHSYFGITSASLVKELMALKAGDSIDPGTPWGPVARAVCVLFAASEEGVVIEGLTAAQPELLGHKLIQNLSHDRDFTAALDFTCGERPCRLLLSAHASFSFCIACLHARVSIGNCVNLSSA